jgi:ABC-type branched-subunit amino acid transport system substrate-binding protein
MRFANRCRHWLIMFASVLALPALSPAASADAVAQSGAGTVEIAAALCLSGDEQPFGQSTLEGIQLAIDEANARGDGPRIAVKTYDEQSTVDGARQAAQQIVASRAPFVLGSVFSFLSLVEGPILAAGGVAALATATSDLITGNPTTFRVLFKNSDQGELLATYINRVLGLKRVAVLWIDDGYGRTLKTGFEAEANRLALDVTYYGFKTDAEAQLAAQNIAADPTRPAVALLMLDGIGARVLPTLRRQGVTSPILGGDSFGDEDFSDRLASEPEEQRRRGAISDGIYGISPMILDSANALTLAFADRYRARFGRDPSWNSAAGYESGLLAAAAVRAVAREGKLDTAAMRAATLVYLQSLNTPAQALPGLLGPIWFDQNRGRIMPVRVARFADGHIESAPLQIVPVTRPSASELTSGAVFELSPGRYGRLQRVVYSGVFLNEISHIDLPRSSFGADFYVWLRFARNAGADSLDPTDINFPNMLSGSFNAARPAEQGEMPDGTVYRLWRVQGEFRNDFDLHNFPFDRQRLELPFFNARGASDRIVYVLDRRTGVGGGATLAKGSQISPIASPTAFDDLTQWRALGGTERRENLVTSSSLGDPRRVATESFRELSGFIASFEVKRLALSTVVKTLMPLLLMTLIIYTTLHFPPVLIKEKVTVAVTGALSGAVLLVAINSQLGSVGYTIAIEYAFFVFFGLTTFSIVAALMAQHLRHTKRDRLAVATEVGTRLVFALAVMAVVAGALWLSPSAGAAQ